MNVNPTVEPEVTAAAVRLTVAGEQTAGGSVMTTVGEVFTVTVTGLMSKQPANVVPFM